LLAYKISFIHKALSYSGLSDQQYLYIYIYIIYYIGYRACGGVLLLFYAKGAQRPNIHGLIGQLKLNTYKSTLYTQKIGFFYMSPPAKLMDRFLLLAGQQNFSRTVA
jgi:hypothetical protein